MNPSFGKYCAALGMALLLILPLCAGAAPVALPKSRIDLQQISVSGLSSGGYMAVQFSVAYSALVKGAGVMAGGPFYCARGDVMTAMTVCSCTAPPLLASCRVTPGGTRVDEQIRSTEQYARQGAIDAPANLAHQRIWLFSGKVDSVVPQPVMDDLLAYYRHYIDPANIQYKNDLAAEHAVPTETYGNPCVRLGDPFINHCQFDGAGQLLQWIYGGTLKAPDKRIAAGQMMEFDQREFIADHMPAGHGLADSGYVYIPASCAGVPAQPCSLHIAFHGCLQNVATVHDKFIRHAGYNRWADSNRMIVLYPQTTATLTNPNGCWNWFDSEHNDPDYATKQGFQMRAIRDMVARIADMPTPPTPVRCFTASNAAHVRAGRAHSSWLFIAQANGSDNFMGPDTEFFSSTLKQVGPHFYEVGSCP